MTSYNNENYQLTDNLLSPYLGVNVLGYLHRMIESQNELDMFPLVKNRSLVNLYPTVNRQQKVDR